MRLSILLITIILLAYSCSSELKTDYENLEFECLEEDSIQNLLEGEFDGKYFCYSITSGHKFKYTIGATIITEGNTIPSNIDSLEGKVVYFNNWQVMKDFRFDSIYNHNIYISTPSFINADSLRNFVSTILEERELDIHSNNLSESFVISFMYNDDGDSSYETMSSFYGKQSNNNYLRITNFSKDELFLGGTRYKFDFEFSCKLYHDRKKHDYFGEITNGILHVDFLME